MAYRLKAKETVPKGIKRVVLEEIGSSLAQLTNDDAAKRDEAIHEARKSIKKIRGVLRLVRPELGQIYSDENVRLRDSGRMLSEIRDAQATIEIFDGLLGRFKDTLQANALSSVRRGLEERKQETENSAHIQQTVQTALSTLRAMTKQVKDWPLESDGFAAIAPGLRQVYRRGRKALAMAQSDPQPVHFHELRKRVKDHWYHIRLLEAVWTDLMKARESSLKDLETWLGDDHNLVVLREAIEKDPEKYGNADNELKLVISLAEQYQQELRERSMSLAVRLYAEKPRQFVKAMSQQWAVWQSQQEQALPSRKRNVAKKRAVSTATRKKSQVA